MFEVKTLACITKREFFEFVVMKKRKFEIKYCKKFQYMIY